MTNRTTRVDRPIELKQSERRPKGPRARKCRLLRGSNAAAVRTQVEELLQAQEQPDLKEFEKLDERAREVVRRMVSDPASRDFPFRREAVSALGFMGDAQSVALLAALATNPDEDPVIVGRAADSLALVGGAGACDLILRAMEHGDGYARDRATRALCALAHPASIEALRAIAQHHPDEYQRDQARVSLGRLGCDAPKSSRRVKKKLTRKERVARDR